MKIISYNFYYCLLVVRSECLLLRVDSRLFILSDAEIASFHVEQFLALQVSYISNFEIHTDMIDEFKDADCTIKLLVAREKLNELIKLIFYLKYRITYIE